MIVIDFSTDGTRKKTEMNIADWYELKKALSISSADSGCSRHTVGWTLHDHTCLTLTSSMAPVWPAFKIPHLREDTLSSGIGSRFFKWALFRMCNLLACEWRKNMTLSHSCKTLPVLRTPPIYNCLQLPRHPFLLGSHIQWCEWLATPD